MKQRPNISIQQKSNTKLEYLKYLATENIQPDVVAPTISVPKGKTKSKPNIKLIKRDISKTNQFRIDMLNYANREFGINPDLLIEYSTYYVLTIISYKLITNNEQPTAKDFDIYCNGLRVDSVTTSVNVGENIVITIQKNDWINVTNEEDFDLITENGEDIII